jgi:hypothetical protein
MRYKRKDGWMDKNEKETIKHPNQTQKHLDDFFFRFAVLLGIKELIEMEIHLPPYCLFIL